MDRLQINVASKRIRSKESLIDLRITKDRLNAKNVTAAFQGQLEKKDCIR